MGLVFVSIQTVCLLVGAFNPFTFKVITNRYILFLRSISLYLLILLIYLFLAVLGLHCCAGATLHCGARVSHCGGFSCCGAQAVGAQASVVVAHGVSCSMACGIFLYQGSNTCPCIGRQILNHCATREAPNRYILIAILIGSLFWVCFCRPFFFPSIPNSSCDLMTDISVVFG